MNTTACTVAVDVGNTAVKLGVQRSDSVIDHAILIGESRWERSTIEWVHDQLGCRDSRWRIASVHRRAAEHLVDSIADAEPQATIDLVTYHDVPMEVAVDAPERLGIDRLLSAYAAYRKWGSPLVVVDAGSAVTVDWVDDRGRFCGGAILPGLGLQARALATGTDALPEIKWTPGGRLSFPAKNTADAIYGGILLGVAAAIDSLADRYFQGSQGKRASVGLVLTGGDAAALSPHLRRSHHQVPNLVCRGLLSLPK